MTPDDLAAIRARLADDDLCWHAITGDAEEPPTHHADRRALLAEVDRLGAAPEKWSDVPVGTVHDHGCRCWPHVSFYHYEAVALAEYRQGKADIAAERSRIRAAVEGLVIRDDNLDPEDGVHDHIEGPCGFRAAVLAAIDGGE